MPGEQVPNKTLSLFQMSQAFSSGGILGPWDKMVHWGRLQVKERCQSFALPDFGVPCFQPWVRVMDDRGLLSLGGFTFSLPIIFPFPFPKSTGHLQVVSVHQSG